MPGWNHDKANWKPKACAVCKKEFTPKSGVNKFCSEICRGKWQYISGRVTTESQYKEISGNWKRYASRLLYAVGKRREHLSQEIILELLEKQNYRCALSGFPLTCNLEKGVLHYTNASIDRIKAGGPYTKDNIRIVCRVTNTMKWTMTDEELLEWCRRVTDYAEEKKKLSQGI